MFNSNTKINLFGLPITIETKRGMYRTGKDANGIPWATKLDSDYGYIRRTVGADGEQIDCYIGQNPHSDLVFVMNQKFPSGRFDEHKVMLGYNSKDEAIQSYLTNNPKAKILFDSMEILTLPQFKQWLMTWSKQRRMEINVVKFKSSLAEKIFIKNTNDAMKGLFGISTREFDSILFKAQSQKHVDTMVKTLVAARDMIKNELVNIKGNASMDDMFAMAKSDLWRKRALFELNRRIHLAGSFKKKLLTLS